jgi:hypothetical protein
MELKECGTKVITKGIGSHRATSSWYEVPDGVTDALLIVTKLESCRSQI